MRSPLPAVSVYRFPRPGRGGGACPRVGFTCSFDLLVAEKSGDLPEVVVDDEECHEQLSCSDAADSASSGCGDDLLARGVELLALGLDGVSDVVVEGQPFFAAVVGCLLRRLHLGEVDGGRVLRKMLSRNYFEHRKRSSRQTLHPGKWDSILGSIT